MHFKLKGTNIHISFLFAALVFVMLSYQNTILPLPILISSLVHEAGHLICMLIFRVKAQAVCFNLFGMRIIKSPRCILTPKAEILIALAGPAFNFILFLISFTNFFCTARSVFLKLALLNAFMCVFNMLPVCTLDGGCALQSFMLQFKSGDTVNKAITVISFITVIPVVVFGSMLLIRTRYNFTLLAAGVYMLLLLVLKKRNRVL